MPRDLPIGNGQLLVNFDPSYCLRDFYYPRVGKENQTLGERSRTGIWAGGRFGWLHEDGWRRSLKYVPDTLVTLVTLEHPELQLRLECHDAVHPEMNVLLRQIKVHNLADHARDIRLFFHYDFHILENVFGDTAYFEPVNAFVIHYKGPRYFVINGRTPTGEGIYQYCTGIKRHQHFEGTWKDAEDGTLSNNPIAQGSVDSTTSFRAQIGANQSGTFEHWVAVDRGYFDVKELNDQVKKIGVGALIATTAEYWKNWSGRTQMKAADSDAAKELGPSLRRSILIVRTQIDNGGAIIAANDSDSIIFNRDTYSYMWPRDGALVAHALDHAGFPELTRRFFEFCQTLMPRPSYYPEGYLLHKFNPDGSFGSSWHPWIRDGKPQLPIQEDETALVLWALNEHYKKCHDDVFINSMRDRLIRPAAKFMLKYRRDDGLPRESYDLWEERYGVLTFTTAAVTAGLSAVAQLLNGPEDHELKLECKKAALSMKRAMEEHLYKPELKRFVRMLSLKPDGTWLTDSVIDASLFAIFHFGVFEPDHPMVVSTMQQIENRLWCKTDVGGVARYENDYYYQSSGDIDKVPGNPWLICTLWLALWYTATAKTLDDLRRPREILDWVAKHSLESGVMAEQIHPYSGAPISVSPLTWSHATYIEAVLDYCSKLEQLGGK
jgi:oligosaccharide amylase